MYEKRNYFLNGIGIILLSRLRLEQNKIDSLYYKLRKDSQQDYYTKKRGSHKLATSSFTHEKFVILFQFPNKNTKSLCFFVS